MNTEPTRYLVLNADDYGMSQSTNEAVEDLFDNGFVASTTLMTPCPWAEDAVARAKRNKKMKVGLHTTLTSEWPGYRWGPVSRAPVPSLLDAWGYLPRTAEALVAQADAADVAQELTAQLAYMTLRGLAPTHLDNHMGSVYGLVGPHFLDVIFALCAADRLPFRMPRTTEGFGAVPPALGTQVDALVGEADRLGIGLPDRLLHFGRRVMPEDTYESVRAHYLQVITRGCVPGINELYMHPALETPELKAICAGWQMHVWEHRLLKDPEFIGAIDAAGIVRTTWVDAPFAARPAQ